MKESQVADYNEICSLYDKITALNESYDLSTSHSKDWLQLYNEMCECTKKIAEKQWPYAAVDALTDPLTGETYPSVDYDNLVLKILKKYEPGTKSKKYPDREVSFWEYYIFILRGNVYQNKSKIKIKITNNHRLFKIPIRKQRKINKMVFLVAKYNKENPGKNINLYSETALNLFLKNNICNDLEELKELLEINKLAYNENNKKKLPAASKEKEKENSEEFNNISEDNAHISSDKSLHLTLDYEYMLDTFLSFISECYDKKMHTKEQKTEDQLKKENFMKDIITCYYMNKLLKLYPNDELSDILKIMKGRNQNDRKFLSIGVINKYIEVQNKIENLRNSVQVNKNELKELKDLGSRKPMTLEFISVAYGKQKNYGTRRISDFRKYVNQCIENMDEQKKAEYTDLLIYS